MTTTTIRLDEELKERLASAAERAGKSAHAFILEAIAQTVAQSELDDETHRLADARWERVLATGKTAPWTKARAYLLARARGQKARAPSARKLKR